MVDSKISKKEVIDHIVDMEWQMMNEVHGLDGRSVCQDDFKTFHIMRFSNYFPWTTELLESYTQDLVRAEEDGRNLVLEKYAYMMSLSDHDYYKAHLQEIVPAPNAFTSKLIREIVVYLLDCERQLAEKYPKISSKGRVLQTSSFDANFASIETYSIGELRTYSPRTLRLLLEFIRSEKALGHNIAMKIRSSMAKLYGYQSLEELELKL